MSGKPNKKPADANKARNEYMESLALQSKINDVNLQANVAYKKNGTIPAISQMADTRSIEEKMKDVEGLKAGIIKDLSPIGEPTFISQVIDKVMSSNLNVDNKLIRYMAQNAPKLVETLQAKYKYGIVGDINDVEQLVNFINALYVNTKNTLQSVRGYANSTTSNLSRSDILSSNDMDKIIRELEDFNKRLVVTGYGYDPQISDRMHALIIRINRIKVVIPSSNELQVLISSLDDNSINNPFSSASDLQELFNMLEYLPKVGTIQTLLDGLQKSLKNRNNLFYQYLEKLENEFNTFYHESDFNALENIFRVYIQPLRQGVIQRNKDIIRNEVNQKANQENLERDAQNVMIVNPQNNAVWTRDANFGVQTIGQQAPIGNVPIPPQGINPLNVPPVVNLGNPLQLFQNSIRQDWALLNGNERQQVRRAINQLTGQVPLDADDAVNLLTPHYINGTYVAQQFGINPNAGQNPFGGFGLHSKRRVGRPRGSGLPKPPPIKVQNYVGFGINEVSKRNLEKGILSVRRNTRSNIADMPSRHISEKLQRVVKTIMGGGIADIKDLNTLDSDEKDYLYKLISKSNLQDRVSVQAPSKDNEEKDIHSFEVMKGEIMAGNDSKELVKKFKLLVVKLTKQGLLPKSESSELLQTLVELGY